MTRFKVSFVSNNPGVSFQRTVCRFLTFSSIHPWATIKVLPLVPAEWSTHRAPQIQGHSEYRTNKLVTCVALTEQKQTALCRGEGDKLLVSPGVGSKIGERDRARLFLFGTLR